jgi:hypothetical protein
MGRGYFKAVLLSILLIVSLLAPLLMLAGTAEAQSEIVLRGKVAAYGNDLDGVPPLELYGIGDRPPIMAVDRIGSGAVVAAGTAATCRNGRWARYEWDILLDNAFQWMVPGAENVLWYGETADYSVYNDADRCSQLIEDLRDNFGYSVDNTVDNVFTEITSGLLAPYEILVIPQLQLGDNGTGGDPSQLPDTVVQTIRNFVVGGGGLLIMESSDFGGHNYYKVQNKILGDLDFCSLDSGFLGFQSDAIYDDTNNWGDPWQPIVDVDTTTDIGSAYEDETGEDEIGLYSPCSLTVAIFKKVCMPDLGQHCENWCWVAAAANSIYWWSQNGYPELIDDPADPQFPDNRYITYPLMPWSTHTVDSAGDVGWEDSIAVDNENGVHISYHGGGYLKYAYKPSGGSWSTYFVDNLSARYTSIAVDNENGVHISYYLSGLKYAYKPSGGSWTTTTVESADVVGLYTSIAVDGENGVHISYYLDIPNSDLKYAYKPSGGSWSTYFVDSTDDVGKWTSIAVDGENGVHISYYDDTNRDLKYAYKPSGENWSTHTVDGTGGVGEYTSIAVDNENGVHISYYHLTDVGYVFDLKYAYKPSGGSWTTTTVDNLGNAGKYTSIAVDGENGVHISYYNEGPNGDLKYAYKPSRSSWSTYFVDSTGDVGMWTSIAVDGKKGVHISYYDDTNEDLKYAYKPPYGYYRLLDEIATDCGRVFCEPVSDNDYFHGLQKFISDQGAPLMVHEIIDPAWVPTDPNTLPLPDPGTPGVVWQRPTFEDYRRELERCQDVLLWLDFEYEEIDHVVTGVGFSYDNTQILVSDPWTTGAPDHNNDFENKQYDIFPVVSEDPFVVFVSRLGQNATVPKMIYISPAVDWEGTATFGLENMYKISLEKDLWLYQGSKLVVKFYKYDNVTLQAESVIENITPPQQIKENENVPHPLGTPVPPPKFPTGTVQIARLVLTTDNTEEVISEIASFTVHQGDLRDRYIDILIDWAGDPGKQPAFRAEIIDILLQWASAPP